MRLHRFALAALLFSAAVPAFAATVTLVPTDSGDADALTGFEDATVVAAEGGNPGTTLGQQRTNVFNAAAAVWGAALTSNIEIKIAAEFATLSCSASSGTLGAAGATSQRGLTLGGVTRWYHVALAESLSGSNLNGSTAEVTATFNSRIDLNDTGCLGTTRWYYGLTGPAPANTIALYPVVLHEIGHGLGFSSFFCTPAFGGNCGGAALGGYIQGVADIWSDFLFNTQTDEFFIDMTDAERVASYTNDPNTVWAGAKVSGHLPDFGQDGAELSQGLMRVYTPSPFVNGSSISHFAEDALPNLLMEPIADSDVFTQTDLTDCLFADIGWINSRCVSRAPTLNTISNPAAILEDATQQTINLSGIDDADNDTQTLSITATSGNTGVIPNPTVTYTSPNATGSLAYTPVANQNGSALITVTATDTGDLDGGGANSIARTFTVNVTAVNDAPVLNAAPAPTLTPVVEDSGAPSGAVGTLVSSLVDFASVGGGLDNVSDVDAAPLLGIAITAADASNGSWHFSTNSGGAWTALGAVSGSVARHLFADAATRVYFQPNADFTGTATITFRAWDRTTGPVNGATGNPGVTGGTSAYSSATDTASASATNTNDAPTSTIPGGTPAANEDTANALAMSVADPDGGILTVTLTSTQGTVSLASLAGLTFSTGDGSGDATMTFSGAITALNTALGPVSFQPVADYNGSASVQFVVNDGIAPAVSKTVNLTVNAVTDITPDTVATTEDVPITFNAITGTNGASADSFENAARAVTAVTQPANGTAAFAANGDLTYTPAANFNGGNSFNYTVTSGGVTETATVTVTVNASNDPPSASNLNTSESFTEDAGAIALVDIVVADIDSANVTATLTLSIPSAGTLSTATAGATTSTFAAGVWTASGPIAQVNTLLAGVTFTPAANFASSFNIGTSVSDGGAGVTGSKPVTANPVNDGPASTAPAAVAATEDTARTFAAGDLLQVSDIDSATLAVTLGAGNGRLTMGVLSGLSFSVGDGTSDPTFTFSGSLANVNAALASLGYAPTADFNGNDTLAFTVNDGTPPVLKNITIVVAAVPDIAPDSVSTNEDTVLAFNSLTGAGGGTADSFENGAAAITGVTQGTIGSVAFAANGTLTYTPNAGVSGNDAFTYTVTSGGVTETGNVSVTIVAQNDPPTASNLSAAESYTEDGGSVNLIDIVAADIDSATLTATLQVSNAAAGTLSTTTASGVTSSFDPGTGVWAASGNVAGVNAVLAATAFQPAPNFNAAFTVATSVSDGVLAVTGSKAFTGTAVNDAPTATVLPIISTAEDTAFAFSGGSAVTVADVDGGTLAVTLAATNGTFTLAPAGLGFSVGDGTADATMTFSATLPALNAALATLTMTPLADFNGSFGMTTTVSDGVAAPAPIGTLVLVNAVPDTVNDLVATARNTPATFNVLTGNGGGSADNFEDAGRTLTAVGTPSDGNVVFQSDGSVTYTPDTNFEGSDSFSYTVTSGGVTENGTVGISVVPPSAPPQATNLSAPEGYVEDTPRDLIDIVVSDDSALLQASVTLSPVAAGALSTGNAGGVQSAYDAGTGVWNVGGTVAQINAQLAALAFVPAADFNAPVTLAVRIQDEAQFIDGSKSLTGTPVNDAPTSSAPTLATVAEDGVLAFAGGLVLHAGDIDHASIGVTLSVDRGVLSLGQTAGLVFGTGDGSADSLMQFSGAPAAVDAALATLGHEPPADFHGDAALQFSVTDTVAAPVDREVGLVVTSVADIADDNLGTLQDTPITFNVMSGANGASADNFEGVPVLVAVTQGVIGSVTFSADGSLTYTPAAGESGNDGFTYTVQSGGANESGNVSVSVGAVNAPPAFDAIADRSVTDSAGLQTVNVTGISAGPGESQALTLAATSGTPAVIADPIVTYASPGTTGTLSFTPIPGISGTTLITVTLRDDGGTANGGVDTFTRTFTITVGPGGEMIFRDGFEGL